MVSSQSLGASDKGVVWANATDGLQLLVLAHDDDSLTDAVAKAQRGDEGAFIDMYREVHPALLRYLRLMVRDHAEDVASEAWAQICRDLTGFRGDGNGFRGWVMTIGRNHAFDFRRAQARRPALSVDPETLLDRPGNKDTAEEAIEHVATSDAIALIASLPPAQAEAVYLRVVLGLDANSVATIMGKRSGAVRMLAHRGLESLRSTLQDGGT